MTRIATAFAKAKEERRTALITYVCGGDPSLEVTEAVVPRIAAAGADIIEIGIPFSDPIADGPVIAAASQRSIERGTTLVSVLETVSRIRNTGCQVPIVLMGYVNPILNMGSGKFFASAAEAGVDGVIIPDLPLEEAQVFKTLAIESKVDLILLAAPTTEHHRLKEIADGTSGFMYFVSVTGVTGGDAKFPADLATKLAVARELSPVPVAVGFGISNIDSARMLAEHSDAVVVGSALVARLADGTIDDACDFVSELSQVVRNQASAK